MAAAAGRRRNRARRIVVPALLLCGALLHGSRAAADPPGRTRPVTIHRICDLIEAHSLRNGLPSAFFARLIWKESRFDPNALSPAGAQGIAQFMPGTARMRGLADPYDIDQAIPASARYLAELRRGFGNLGLAAAAYNAGESRVTRWLGSGGFLPLETEAYVLDVMGEPADNFTDAGHAETVPPLDPTLRFGDSCRRLPITLSATVPMADIAIKPWGIQVAGNFRRAVAVGQWQRLKERFPALLAAEEPVVSRVRTPIGRSGIYAVRIGADDRASADAICRKLHSAGGSCVVLRNR